MTRTILGSKKYDHTHGGFLKLKGLKYNAINTDAAFMFINILTFGNEMFHPEQTKGITQEIITYCTIYEISTITNK